MIDKSYGVFAHRVSNFIGSVWAVAILISALLISGFYSDFSHTWETRVVTIMTFLALVAVLFLQRSQQHNDKATHLKLDELVKAVEGARSEVAEVEKEPEEVIDNYR